MNAHDIGRETGYMQTAQRRQYFRQHAGKLPLHVICELPEPQQTEAKRALTGHEPWAWESNNKMFYLKPSDGPIKLPRKENICFEELPSYKQKGDREREVEVSNRYFDRPISATAEWALLLVDLYPDQVEEITREEYFAAQSDEEPKAQEPAVDDFEDDDPEVKPQEPSADEKSKAKSKKPSKGK